MLFFIESIDLKFKKKIPERVSLGFEGPSEFRASCQIRGMEASSGEMYQIYVHDCGGIRFIDKSIEDAEFEARESTRVIGGIYKIEGNYFIDGGGELVQIYEAKDFDVRILSNGQCSLSDTPRSV